MNKNPEVDTWFETYDNPRKEEVLKVRELILASNPKMTEDIKWKAPNFMYKGNLCTFNPRAKKLVTLIFHTGASLKDSKGLLEGDGKTARVARFHNMEDILSKKEAIEAIVNEWIALKG